MIRYLILLFAAMDLLALCLYGLDKRRAKRHRWRISEAALLSIGFFGGALGALAGMYLWRHKTKHWYFWAVNLLGLTWQLGLCCLLH